MLHFLQYLIDIPLFVITIFASLVYIILLLRILNGWNETKELKSAPNYTPTTKISVVIAARNEATFIGHCIHSILNNNYPNDLFEIIIVNDHSEDSTEIEVNSFSADNVTLINLEESTGKKSAIELGVSRAKGELIACTDADCQVPQDWLRTFAQHYEMTYSKCIAGLIVYNHDKSILQRFQYLDAINNMCVTANGIQRKSYYMANGANLFFTKEIFLEIGGYREKANFASGDDMFLIQEVAKLYPNDVSFLKSQKAIVKTQAETTYKGLINQRARWATKSKAYSNKSIIKIQGFVFFFVALIFLNFLLIPFGTGMNLFGFSFALIVKLTTDLFYLSTLSNYFRDRDPLYSFFSASFGFMIYIIFAGIKALSPTSYNWKGRKTK